MKSVRKKKLAIIAFLVLVEITSIFLVYKSNSDNKTFLDNVMLNDNEILSGEMFAIMLEQEDGSYKESDDNTWPTSGYNYDSTRSGCIDSKGNRLEGVLTFDSVNKIASVETGNTGYCYLYFSKSKNLNDLCGYETVGTTLPGCIINKKDDLYLIENLSKDILGGMYRYQGSSEVLDNNYVCFGDPNDYATCKSNPEMYMYRIIGITADGWVKVIKKNALDVAYYWHNDSTQNIIWPDSDIFKGLNDIEGGTYDYLLTSVLSKRMLRSIWSMDWKYGNLNLEEANNEIDEIYNIENSWTDSVNTKIGLLYLHDYYYSLAQNCYGNVENEICLNSWIHLSNNDENPPSSDEMMLTTLNNDAPNFNIWKINENGVVNYSTPTNTYSVRPVFYIHPGSMLMSGEGTISNPYYLVCQQCIASN